MTAEDVIKEVMLDKSFYNVSGGGMTISGGEPLFNGEFSYELARLARENGMTVCIETSGFGKSEFVKKMCEVTEIFLLDWKVPARMYLETVGIEAEKVISNLSIMNECGNDIILRCPMIPGVNMREPVSPEDIMKDGLTKEHIDGILTLAANYKQIKGIELEPYHPFGIAKSMALNENTKYDHNESLPNEKLLYLRNLLEEKSGLPIKIL